VKYLIVIEKTDNGFSAYVPDLPGCIAAGDTVEETEELMQGAIAMHIRGMREDGLEIPPPSIFKEVDVAVR